METIAVETGEREAVVDITGPVAEVVKRRVFRDGVLHIFCPHTTGAVAVNEGYDPAVRGDILGIFRRLAPRDDPSYRHGEDNADAHVKAVLVGNACAVPVADGRLALGRWQAIFFCEFDGPRRREVKLVFTRAAD